MLTFKKSTTKKIYSLALPSGNHQICAERLRLVPSLILLQPKVQQFPTTHRTIYLQAQMRHSVGHSGEVIAILHLTTASHL